jgi:hypothetical protein
LDLLATPLLAKECRIYIHDLAPRLGVPVKGSGLADGIEVFPKHDAIGSGEFGNAIRGPLDSGPSGSLLLSHKALSSSTSCRFIPAHRYGDFSLVTEKHEVAP